MLRRAIAMNPNYVTAYVWLSETLHELGRREEAVTIAEHAVALDPLSPLINNQVGLRRTDVGRFSDARVAYARAIQLDPELAIAYSNLGDLLAYGYGRLDRAVPWYVKAVSLDPASPWGLGTILNAYWCLGMEAETNQWLERTLSAGEGNALSNYVAALVYLDRGDMKAAHHYAQVAADMEPWTMSLIRDEDLRRGDFAGARTRYAKAFPELLGPVAPAINMSNVFAAIELAVVLQHTGEQRAASALLDGSEGYLRTIPRNGPWGYQLADVQIHALRGDKPQALRALRQAAQDNWRINWSYYSRFDPALDSIRNEPEFKAVFADIERDMARQRAQLVARPKDAKLAW
jgi:tetratricopeptide (TPR) repeat protein